MIKGSFSRPLAKKAMFLGNAAEPIRKWVKIGGLNGWIFFYSYVGPIVVSIVWAHPLC